MKVRDFINIMNWTTFDICKEDEHSCSKRIMFVNLKEVSLDTINTELLNSEIRVVQPICKNDDNDPFDYFSIIIK